MALVSRLRTDDVRRSHVVTSVNDILAEAREFGYLGPGPIEDHVEQANAFGDAAASSVGARVALRIADLGTGGGLPGLVLMERWPNADWVFLDANQRRMATLLDALERLEPTKKASVVVGRAEETVRRPDLRATFDLVFARGFAEAAVTAECAAPLLSVGGTLVVSDPPVDRQRWDSSGLAQLGLVGERVVVGTYAFFVGRQVSLCDDRYPRRVGIPAKRPLFR